MFRRLVKSAVAYQASSIVAAVLALVTLPLYTKYLPPGAYGYAEALLTAIILASILVRFGIGEALIRFWFDDDDAVRRRMLARSVTGWTLCLTSLLVLAALPFLGQISELLLDYRDPTLIAAGLLGIWAFTNLEIVYALLRVQELRRVYLAASLANVLLTVTLMTTFVIVFNWGAAGYVFGNYLASFVVLCALWCHQRRYIGLVPRSLRSLLLFGGPTVPADAAIFALNVVDRAYLLHATTPVQADRYALAAKLSTLVIVAVRGFQVAWPPLAYSITDHRAAQRLYARVTTAYVAFTGLIVAAITLGGPWGVRLLASDERFYAAAAALPWVAAGWALYGLVLVLVTVAGRAKVTTRNLPAALAGLITNIVLLLALVGPLGIAGAGIALCGAYLVMTGTLYLLTRSLFDVPFEWGRICLALVCCVAVSVTGVLLIDDEGSLAFLLRLLIGATLPLLLIVTGVISWREVMTFTRRLRRR